MNTTRNFTAPEAALLKDYGLDGQSISPLLADRIRQDAASHYVWIAKATAAELRAARPLAVLGAAGKSMIHMCGGRGSIRAIYGNLTPMDESISPHHARQWHRALARIDARLAGTMATVTTPARLSTAAPKATVAPVAPKATTAPAKPLFGLDRVVAAFNAELAANRKGGK